MNKEKAPSFDYMNEDLKVTDERIDQVNNTGIFVGLIIVFIAILSGLAYYYDFI